MGIERITLPSGEIIDVTNPEVKSLARTVRELIKENKKLKARVTKLEDDVSYYKNFKAYDGWDVGGGF